MGTTGDLLLTLAGVAVVFAAPLEWAAAALIGFWLLVPGTLVVPHASHLVLVDRAVLYAFALRLALRAGGPREPAGRAYTLTPIHAALAVLVVVGFFDGVVAPAASVSLAGDLHQWLYLVDLAVLFVVVLAVARTVGPARLVRPVVAGVAAAVAIGLVERWHGHGWSHFFFEGLPSNYLAPGANLLTTRGGHVRAQAAAQFSLEYGWVLAMLFPLTLAAVLRWLRPRRPLSLLTLALPAALLGAVVLSGSRSAEVAAVVGGVLFVVLSGWDRRLLAWGGAAAALCGVVVATDPGFVTTPFSSAAGSDPTSVRLDRLPELFSLVHHPLTGVGFNGLAGTFGGVDNAYALVYATIGVLGLLAWAALMVVALCSVGRALLLPSGSEGRRIGTACFLGIIGLAFACASYDVVSTLQSQWALVVLAALGTAAAEARAPVPRVHRHWGLRAVLPVLGALGGGLVYLAAPTSAAESLSVLTVAPYISAYDTGPFSVYTGTTLVNTLCATVTSPSVAAPGTAVHCDQATNFFPANPPGLALVTVSGPTPEAVRTEVHRAFAPIYSTMAMVGGPTQGIRTGRPAWATTAPLWGAAAGVLVMTLVPARRRHREDRRRPPGAGDDLAEVPPEPLGAGVG